MLIPTRFIVALGQQQRKCLNPIVYNVLATSSSKRNTSHFTYTPDVKAPIDGKTTKMNMFQAINNALDIAMAKDDSAVIFGEDVAFGGVFRCTVNLQVCNYISVIKICVRIGIHCSFCIFLEKIW